MADSVILARRCPAVCIATETYFPEVGGGESQARLLAQSLTERGSRVSILARRSDPTSLPAERWNGAAVHRLPPSGRGRWRKWGLAATAYPSLLRLREEWEVLLVSGFRILGAPAVRAARRLKRPCVLKADSNGEMSGEYFRAGLAGVGLTPSSSAVRWLLAARNRWLRGADAFVAISATIAAELDRAGVPSRKIHRIPNAVDMARFSPSTGEEKADLRRELGLPEAALVFTYVGRLVRYKGLPLLLDVWEAVCRERPDARLLLVGPGGDDLHNCEAELRSTVETRGMQDQVCFTGAVDEVEVYLRASDAFVFPTEEEAFGISLLEAMACGLPAVTTRVGAIPEVAREDEALLIAPRDPIALKRALLALAARPELRAEVGRKASARAASFSAAVVADAYEQLFLELLRTGPGGRLPGSGTA